VDLGRNPSHEYSPIQNGMEMITFRNFNYNIHAIKKFKSKDLIKIIERFRSFIINTNK
jgi:ADP-dependent phosphofructokinase/glucokinase